MKLSIIALLAFGMSASGVMAAETIVASKIDAVDLHPDCAEISRIGQVGLAAGETSIVVGGLSPRLVERSVRVSGLEADGITIRSVTVRRAPLAATSSPTPAQQALLDEQEDLQGHIAALEAKQAMIRKASEATATISIGSSVASGSSADWSAIWTKVSDGLEDTEHRLRQSRHRLASVTAALDAFRATAARSQGFETVLDVVADHATKADLKLVYQVEGARWQPRYDARLRTDRQTAQLELTRRASVVQDSGETWTDVALTLSTSALAAATAAPTLQETSDVTGDSRRGIVGRPAPVPQRAATRVDDIDPSAASPFDATLIVPGRVTVASGPTPTIYKVGSRTIDADLSVRAVPIADKRAYLQARFENTDPVALIPGNVELYRDGAFVGRSAFAGALPGSRVTIGFGADELVSVERSDISRRERNTTVDAGIASVERAFKTVVTNRHPFPIKIEIDDREPAFNNVAIVLTERDDMTPPTNRQVDGKRGVLSWIATYAAGETRDTILAWRVKWPAKLGPIQDSEQTQVFRFSAGATF